MKKIISILFVGILFIGILTGCGCASNFNYELDFLKEEVVSAEIVEITWSQNDEPIFNTINSIGDDDLERMLTDLSNLQFIWTEGRPQIANGVCLKLDYANDEYELIFANAVMKFNNKNEHISQKDIYEPKGFDNFISKYKIE